MLRIFFTCWVSGPPLQHTLTVGVLVDDFLMMFILVLFPSTMRIRMGSTDCHNLGC